MEYQVFKGHRRSVLYIAVMPTVYNRQRPFNATDSSFALRRLESGYDPANFDKPFHRMSVTLGGGLGLETKPNRSHSRAAIQELPVSMQVCC